MKNYFFSTSIILSFFIIYSNSLMIVIDSLQEFCLNKHVIQGDVLKVSFLISGENQELLSVSIKDHDNNIFYHNKINNKIDSDEYYTGIYRDSGNFNITINESSIYHIINSFFY
jgi:hypothetical protein